jgi:hypothetical protein
VASLCVLCTHYSFKLFIIHLNDDLISQSILWSQPANCKHDSVVDLVILCVSLGEDEDLWRRMSTDGPVLDERVRPDV